jgi:hypothetical protein
VVELGGGGTGEGIEGGAGMVGGGRYSRQREVEGVGKDAVFKI